MNTQGVEVRESSTQGFGIFTLGFFKQGETIRQVNIIRENTASAPLQPDDGELFEHCAYPDGKVVLYGPPDCYMNHSCEPNVFYDYTQEPPVTRAMRDIAPGEELKVDYLINNSGGDSWRCECGAARCRGETGTSYFDLPLTFQQEYLAYLAPWFFRRHQEKIEIIRQTLATENKGVE